MAQVHVMLKDLPKEEFGPHIDFREYSFLENPSLPKEVISSDLLFFFIFHLECLATRDVSLCPNCFDLECSIR
jgi:hypothetical protein